MVKTDQQCMARAISISWAKLNKCSPAEWIDIAQSRGSKTNQDIILMHRKVLESYYRHVCQHRRKEQTDLAKAISG